MKIQLQLKSGYQNIEVTSVGIANFTEGLETELHKHKAPVLVMAPRKRSFLKKMTSRSRTKQMVLETNLPLLALPIHTRTRKAQPKPEALTELSFV